MFRLVHAHQAVVNFAGGQHGTHWNGSVGESLRNIHDVGLDAKGISTERRADATKARNDLIENQQNIVFIAKIPQPLQIPLAEARSLRRILTSVQR